MSSLAKLLDGVKPSAEHADVLLEISYLVTAVDGRLDDDELRAFRDLASSLRSKELSDSEVDALLDRFAGNVEHAEIIERVKALVPKLPPELREKAFKLSVGLSIADMDQSDTEHDLQDILAETIGLGQDRVDELVAEVYAGLDAGED
jgi:uncharacterized tellurite resistance protein B-like protein